MRALRTWTFLAGVTLWASAGSACASRTTLHSQRSDASDADDTDTDPGPIDTGASEARSEEVAPGPACATRAPDCPIDDFGPRFALIKTYETCAAKVANECGDLYLVFDAEGCLAEVKDIRDFSPAFVACVVDWVSAHRWQCGSNKTFRMLQACS